MGAHRSIVVFDLGGVMTVPPWVPIDAYGVEIGLPEGAMSSYFRDDPVFAQLERGEISLRDFMKSVGTRVQERHGIRVDLRALGRAGIVGGEMNPEMIGFVSSLHRAGVRLGLLTNNTKEAPDWRSRIPIECFDVVIDSSDVGMRKPDPAIYRLLLDQLGAAGEDVVFVDDTRSNLPPAAALGIATVHFVDPAEGRAAIAGLCGLDVATLI
jgi:epoxide hydrolase-like predicted phosphatase